MKAATTPKYVLEPDATEMRALVDAAMERIVEHIESLPSQPSFESGGSEELARTLIEPLPEDGAPFENLLDLLFDRVVPLSYNSASPGYLAYIPGGGIFAAAVADLIADCVNRYVGVWVAAPGLVQLELNAVRWLCQIIGYPPEAGGILTSGGSLATFSAVTAARHEHLGEDAAGGTLYCSDQAHYSVGKAARLAGLPSEALRVVPTDARLRIRVDALAAAITEDRAAGRRPFLVVGSAGTTNTGAVDDLEALAELAVREGLWFHADAAYGGFFAMTERGRKTLAGLARADSVTLDPHKGLFLPYGTGSLLVRDREALRRVHSQGAAYMPPMREEGEVDFVDFCQLSPELSRPFRGLRVWLAFKLYGAAAFRTSLDEKLDLTEWAYRALQDIPGIEIVAPPRLSIVAFRLADQGGDVEAENVRNRALLERINARRRVYLTGTTVAGRFVLRICILSFRTHRDRMEACLADIREAVAEVGAPIGSR